LTKSVVHHLNIGAGCLGPVRSCLQAVSRHFRTELRAVLSQSEADVLRRLKAQASETYEERRGDSPDPLGLMVVSTCALILASYRELTRNGVAEDRAIVDVTL
jgi:hypothetical protein